MFCALFCVISVEFLECMRTFVCQLLYTTQRQRAKTTSVVTAHHTDLKYSARGLLHETTKPYYGVVCYRQSQQAERIRHASVGLAGVLFTQRQR